MPRYLITGAKGFIGKHLINYIRLNASSSNLISAGRERDLTDSSVCQRFFKECGPVDYIYHLADVSGNAQWASAHSADQYFVNARISLNVLESWRSLQPQARLIGFSTLWAYPEQVSIAREENYWDGPLHEPTQHYGFNKKFFGVGLRACKQQNQLKGTMLVLGSVYGPGDRSDHVIPSLIQRMKDNPLKLEVWGDGNQTRDFIFVDDQIRAIDLHKDFDGDLLNISGEKTYSIREVVNTLVRLTHYSGEVVYKPQAGGGVSARRMDMSRSRHESGWPDNFRLHSLEEGLSKMLQDTR